MSIEKAPVTGGAPTVVAEGLAVGGPLLSNSSSFVWWDESGVKSMPITGGAVTLVTATTGVGLFAVDEAFAYFYTGDPQALHPPVYRVPLGGGTPEELTPQNQSPAFGNNPIAIDDSSIFFLARSMTSYSIQRMSKSGGNPTDIARFQASALSNDAFPVDDRAIYFVTAADHGNDEVYSVAMVAK